MPRSAGGSRKCVREEMRRVESHVTRNRRGQAPRWGAGVRRCLARPTGLLSADRGKRGSGGARSSRQGWDGGWDGTGKGGMEPARLWLGPARAQYRSTARWRRSSRGSSSRAGYVLAGGGRIPSGARLFSAESRMGPSMTGPRSSGVVRVGPGPFIAGTVD